MWETSKTPARGTDRYVLLSDARVLDRHLPAGEGDEPGPRRHVAVVQRSPLERLRTGGHARPDPSSATARFTVAACVALLALLAGCGNDGPEPGNLPDALGYIPRDAHVVMLMATDLEGDQWQRFGHLVEPELKGSEFSTVRKNLAASIPDVNFDTLAPLLGDTLVARRVRAPESLHELAVLHTPDADVAQHVAEGIRNGDAIADGSTLVVELDGGNYELDPAVDRHGAGTGMDPETFASRFGDGADDDALVRVLADDEQIVPGVRSAALELRLDSDAVKLRVRTRADESQQLEQILKALAAGGLHRFPATGTRYGLVGDRLVAEADPGHRANLHLVPLGTPTADVRTSGDVVEGELTIPVPGGL